ERSWPFQESEAWRNPRSPPSDPAWRHPRWGYSRPRRPLDAGMAADRGEAGERASWQTAREGDINQSTDRRGPVGVLREAHGPDEVGIGSGDQEPGEVSHSVDGRAAFPFEICPGLPADGGRRIVEAGGVVAHEVAIDSVLLFQQGLEDAVEE